MIGLVDGNNFYVSCERVFDLSLAGKPVAVLSNNDGCVISRSYELKALSIPMGAPYFKLRPYVESSHIVLRSSNYELYGDLSRRVIAILREFAPEVSPYSIDESFIEVKLPEGQDYTEYGKRIRSTVLKWIGIPCGVGFARTYTLAKLANHIAKKRYDGIYTMPDDPLPLLRGLPVDEIWGVGRHLAPKLAAIGISTAYDLAIADEALLRRRFNVTLARTSRELRGEAAIDLNDCEESPQSISCSRSFGYPVTKLSDIREAVASYAATAARRLREKRKRAAGVNIYLQTFQEEGGHPRTSSISGTTVTFDIPTAATAEMLTSISPRIDLLFTPGMRYRKAGVVFFGLESIGDRQLDLFTDTERNDRSEKVSRLADSLNRCYGKGALFNLSEGIGQEWKMRRELLSPSYTTKWEDLPTVD